MIIQDIQDRLVGQTCENGSSPSCSCGPPASEVETTNAHRLDYNLIDLVPFSFFAVCVKASPLMPFFQLFLTKY
jgi:hypothetical protein